MKEGEGYPKRPWWCEEALAAVEKSAAVPAVERVLPNLPCDLPRLGGETRL